MICDDMIVGAACMTVTHSAVEEGRGLARLIVRPERRAGGLSFFYQIYTVLQYICFFFNHFFLPRQNILVLAETYGSSHTYMAAAACCLFSSYLLTVGVLTQPVVERGGRGPPSAYYIIVRPAPPAYYYLLFPHCLGRFPGFPTTTTTHALLLSPPQPPQK